MSAPRTHGPWKVKTSRVIVAPTIHRRHDGGTVEYMKEMLWVLPARSCDGGEGARLAIAHLVSAAPELLAANKAARNLVRDLLDGKGVTDARLLEVEVMTGAAIAKAEGRS